MNTYGLTHMAYDAMLTADQANVSLAAARDDFRRAERLIMLIGAVSMGALVGFAATIMTGRTDTWVVIATAAIGITFALYLTSLTLVDALRRDARGCAIGSRQRRRFQVWCCSPRAGAARRGQCIARRRKARWRPPLRRIKARC
jgi:hypothetical protein